MEFKIASIVAATIIIPWMAWGFGVLLDSETLSWRSAQVLVSAVLGWMAIGLAGLLYYAWG